ncbi:MAG: hypothetical protein R3301_06685 [Saprospiraceae bacterium]|nr:hypothetical protein [Saprospiraceae bacterium]
MNTHVQTRLIGDVGSTGSRWALLRGSDIRHVESTGFNPRTQDPELLSGALQPLVEVLPSVDEVYYYGTGILDESDREVVSAAFGQFNPSATLHVASDLTGAARSTGTESAIVCILGTGSNSCLYDGHEITDQIPTLGYPLGDQGSGWRIGAELINRFYQRSMPAGIASEFGQHVPKDHRVFLEDLKGHPAPNRYLASFARFAADRQDVAWISQLICRGFSAFVAGHVLPYGTDLPVKAVGGIAAACEELLRSVLAEAGKTLATVVADPLPGLVTYHNTQS